MGVALLLNACPRVQCDPQAAERAEEVGVAEDGHPLAAEAVHHPGWRPERAAHRVPLGRGGGAFGVSIETGMRNVEWLQTRTGNWGALSEKWWQRGGSMHAGSRRLRFNDNRQ